jgi:hypothetical protein
MLDVDPKDLLEMAAPDDQQPVQALGADRPHPALGMRIRPWCPHRRAQHLNPFGSKSVSAAAVNFVSGNWNRLS